MMVLLLFGYAFLSNVALAVVPHEPVIVWYGERLGLVVTALVATGGTVAASWVDYRLFARLIARAAEGRELWQPVARVLRGFARAPFAVIALSGLTPLPFFPFKAMAFSARYPLGRYLAAVAAGRLPRYLVLAWLGVVLKIPAWALVDAALLLAIPMLLSIPLRTPSSAT